TELAAAVFKDQIVLIGGHMKRSDIYLSNDGVTWTKHAPPREWGPARGLIQLQVLGDQLYLLGGGTDEFNARSDVWSTDNALAWSRKSALCGCIGGADHASAVFDGRLWVSGGVIWSEQKGTQDGPLPPLYL